MFSNKNINKKIFILKINFSFYKIILKIYIYAVRNSFTIKLQNIGTRLRTIGSRQWDVRDVKAVESFKFSKNCSGPIHKERNSTVNQSSCIPTA